MGDIYVRSTDGSNADNGSTWGLAKVDLAGAAAIDAAGDTIWLSGVHSELGVGVGSAPAFAGTIANPVRVFCGDNATQPPTALATTAVVATSGANSDINIHGHIHAYGVTFIAGSGTSAVVIRLANAANDCQVYEQCSFQLGSTAVSNKIRPVNGSAANIANTTWKDCTVKFASASQWISIIGGIFTWSGGGILSGGSSVNVLFGVEVGGMALARIDNVDFSNIASSADLCTAGNGLKIIISDCKLPASWSGGLITGTRNAVFRAEMYNCDSGDTNYGCWIEDGYGTIRDFSTLYLSGTDGIKHNGVAVPLSYKMSGNANTRYPSGTLEGMWMILVNETTTSQTATLEIIHNEPAALNDDEIWLAVDYPATPGITLFTRLTDAKADVLASAAPQASSTADWDDGLTERGNSTLYTGGNIIKSSGTPGSAFICTVTGTSAASVPGGYTSAADGASITDGTATFKAMRRQKLAATFTAAEQGIIRARPVLAKTNAVIWAASKISVA